MKFLRSAWKVVFVILRNVFDCGFTLCDNTALSLEFYTGKLEPSVNRLIYRLQVSSLFALLLSYSVSVVGDIFQIWPAQMTENKMSNFSTSPNPVSARPSMAVLLSDSKPLWHRNAMDLVRHGFDLIIKLQWMEMIFTKKWKLGEPTLCCLGAASGLLASALLWVDCRPHRPA